MTDLRKVRIKEFVNAASKLAEEKKDEWADKTADQIQVDQNSVDSAKFIMKYLDTVSNNQY